LGSWEPFRVQTTGGGVTAFSSRSDGSRASIATTAPGRRSAEHDQLAPRGPSGVLCRSSARGLARTRVLRGVRCAGRARPALLLELWPLSGASDAPRRARLLGGRSLPAAPLDSDPTLQVQPQSRPRESACAPVAVAAELGCRRKRARMPRSGSAPLPAAGRARLQSGSAARACAVSARRSQLFPGVAAPPTGDRAAEPFAGARTTRQRGWRVYGECKCAWPARGADRRRGHHRIHPTGVLPSALCSGSRACHSACLGGCAVFVRHRPAAKLHRCSPPQIVPHVCCTIDCLSAACARCAAPVPRRLCLVHQSPAQPRSAV
jgi:hypothetical protein